MKLIDALAQSDVDCATYVNANGFAYNIDGSGSGWYVTSGPDGMPPTTTALARTRDDAMRLLSEAVPVDVDQWEPVMGE